MLAELKTIKERLVNARRMLPERLKPLTSALPQLESLAIGVTDISQWIEAGLALLASHRIDGNINKVEDRLDQHKVMCHCFLVSGLCNIFKLLYHRFKV